MSHRLIAGAPRRAVFITTCLFLLAPAASACGPGAGDQGGTCVFSGSGLNSGPTCNSGLVCDETDNQCKPAGSAGSGTACFGDGDPLCASDLACTFDREDASGGWFCRPRIAPGANCPLGDDVCVSGYACTGDKQSATGTCTSVDAGRSTAADAAGGDAASD